MDKRGGGAAPFEWGDVLLTFQTFASGSSGNAALLSQGETHVLIDMGISCRRITQALGALGLRPETLSAVCVTHEHRDHVSGLDTFVKKYRTPVLCSAGTARQLSYRIAGIELQLAPFVCGDVLTLGDLTVRTFPLSHDVSDGAGYRFDGPEGSLGVLTDTGYITDGAREALLGVDFLMLEANHDVECLRAGPYPYQLKERVLGACGHLSNAAAARFACESAARGTCQILLAHLSAENNTPAMAKNAVGRALAAAGYKGTLSVAPRSEAGPVYQIARREVRL